MLRFFSRKNNIGFLSLVSLSLLSFALINTASAKTSFTTAYSYFNIHGTSVENIWKSINTNGPKSKKGVGHAGYTSFKLNSPVKFVTKNGKCHISSARFTMQSNIQLPKWLDRSRASSDLKIYWKALFNDVKRHEEEHVKIAEAAIVRLSKAVNALKPQKNCKKLNQKISRLANANRRKLNRAQNSFERKEIRGQKARINKLIKSYKTN